VSLLYSWSLAEQVQPVVEFALERYPASIGLKATLADAHTMRGDYAAAVAVYEQLLQQLPDEPAIKARLESLRNQR
jgi:cytochrome c-type biogenesis protein CcmH/NrfG